jgi:hypothetical protein
MGALRVSQMKVRWIAILECAAAVKLRVSSVSSFGAKMFAEAGVRSVIFARTKTRAPGTDHFTSNRSTHDLVPWSPV